MSLNKTLIVFLVSLLIPIFSFSQTIYQNLKGDTLVTITPSQLKATNLIFVEHQYLLKENTLLNEKISNLELLNSNLVTLSSLKDDKLNEFNNKIKSQQLTEDRLNKDIDRLLRKHKVDLCISGGLAIAVTVLLIFGNGN